MCKALIHLVPQSRAHKIEGKKSEPTVQRVTPRETIITLMAECIYEEMEG